MKKLKILPSLLMLVLCFGVLAVGIYALTPTQNAISGTITVNTANSPVKIQTYLGTTLKETFNTVRAGETLTYGDLSFFASAEDEANSDPNEIRLSMKITNIGTYTVGAYFADSEANDITESNIYADGTSDIIVQKQYKENEKVIAQAYMSSYTPIGVGKTVEMCISITLQNFPTTQKVFDLDIDLFVEKYTATEEYGSTTSKLVKLPDSGLSEINLTSEVSGSAVYVAIPDGISFEEYYYDEDSSSYSATYNKYFNYPLTATSCYTAIDRDFVFIPSHLTSYGTYFSDADGINGTISKYVISYFNEEYSNDASLRFYNKDKTVLFVADGAHMRNIPSSVIRLAFEGEGLAWCSSNYDLSGTNIETIDCINFCDFNPYSFIFPESLKLFDGYDQVGGGFPSPLTLTFKTTTPPAFPTINQWNRYMLTFSITLIVPEGSEQAYADAFLARTDPDYSDIIYTINGTEYHHPETW